MKKNQQSIVSEIQKIKIQTFPIKLINDDSWSNSFQSSYYNRANETLNMAKQQAYKFYDNLRTNKSMILQCQQNQSLQQFILSQKNSMIKTQMEDQIIRKQQEECEQLLTYIQHQKKWKTIEEKKKEKQLDINQIVKEINVKKNSVRENIIHHNNTDGRYSFNQQSLKVNYERQVKSQIKNTNLNNNLAKNIEQQNKKLMQLNKICSQDGDLNKKLLIACQQLYKTNKIQKNQIALLHIKIIAIMKDNQAKMQSIIQKYQSIKEKQQSICQEPNKQIKQQENLNLNSQSKSIFFKKSYDQQKQNLCNPSIILQDNQEVDELQYIKFKAMMARYEKQEQKKRQSVSTNGSVSDTSAHVI